MIWHYLAAAALAAGSAVEAPPFTPGSPAEHPGDPVDELSLKIERYQRLTVPVMIQGQGPFNFMVDTGAQATVVSRGLADRLVTDNRRTATLVGMASRVPTETVGIADLSLGKRNFYVRTAPLVDALHIGEADGILGLDSLQDQRVLIDFEKRTLVVADAPQSGTSRGFDIVVTAREKLGQLIITEATLDGVKTAVIVDTGAQGSIGNPALLERLRRMRTLGPTELTDVNGHKLQGEVRVARELALGVARLRSFPVMFAESPTFHALGLDKRPALILGMAELQLFKRVAIDFRSRRVLFDLPSATPFSPTQWDTFGS